MRARLGQTPLQSRGVVCTKCFGVFDDLEEARKRFRRSITPSIWRALKRKLVNVLFYLDLLRAFPPFLALALRGEMLQKQA